MAGALLLRQVGSPDRLAFMCNQCCHHSIHQMDRALSFHSIHRQEAHSRLDSAFWQGSRRLTSVFSAVHVSPDGRGLGNLQHNLLPRSSTPG